MSPKLEVLKQFLPRDAMLARDTLSFVRPSVCLPVTSNQGRGL